jgi:hypothetical protein
MSAKTYETIIDRTFARKRSTAIANKDIFRFGFTVLRGRQLGILEVLISTNKMTINRFIGLGFLVKIIYYVTCKDLLFSVHCIRTLLGLCKTFSNKGRV